MGFDGFEDPGPLGGGTRALYKEFAGYAIYLTDGAGGMPDRAGSFNVTLETDNGSVMDWTDVTARTLPALLAMFADATRQFNPSHPTDPLCALEALALYSVRIEVEGGGEWASDVWALSKHDAGKMGGLFRHGFNLPLRGAEIRIYVDGDERFMDDRPKGGAS